MIYDVIKYDSCLIKKARETPGDRLVLTEESSGIVAESGDNYLEITCRDISTLAWGMNYNRHFFHKKYGVYVDHNTNPIGDGTQQITIERRVPPESYQLIIVAYFEAAYRSDDYIYESDLISDTRTGRLTTRNSGKRRFKGTASSILIVDEAGIIEWVNQDYTAWTSDLKILSRPHSTLSEWIASGLDMSVRCSSTSCLTHPKFVTLSNEYLKNLPDTISSLDILTSKLTCSRCRSNRPHIRPVFGDWAPRVFTEFL